MIRGNDRRLRVQIRDGAGPKDLTGYTVEFTAKRRIGDANSAAIIRLSTAPEIGGLTIVPGEVGVVTGDIPASATESLPDVEQTRLYYDLRLQKGGKIQTVSQDFLYVSYSVTRNS